ncbi:ComF family protein [Halomonas sp. HNIBRBA4712]|uniref:ComF family protein n=1 Tax=Halomonas sp. HNIBRBA4712 TaxID=3373087 RepID=UPI0037456676
MFKKALPGYCAFCLSPRANIEGWCDACYAGLEHNRGACPRCQEPLAALKAPEHDRLCGHCLADPPAFTATRAAFLYEGAIKALVRDFKFHASPRAGTLLVELMLKHPPLEVGDALLAVPMHPARARERGFNQAQWLAAELARRLDVPLLKAKCVKRLPTQRTLSRRQRAANLKGAFELPESLPAHITVIDDVITTGATGHELARQALRGGATRVDLWAPARTPLGRS